MKITTSWLKPPTRATGLDHLGTQAPCVKIYGQLLPGITNVTDRARYYSFYPWVVWSYDQRFSKDDFDHFVDMFRRADCLFTLISERHSRQAADAVEHGIAMAGRNNLLPALDRLTLGEVLKLSDYATQDEADTRRYFKSKLGGFSQYYAGTLLELGIMQPSSRSWSYYTKQNGEHLAASIESAAPAELFWAAVEKNEVSLSDLDELSAFCVCSIESNVSECHHLRGIFFDTENKYAEDGTQRRRSLGLIQQLVNALPEGVDISQDVFRACTYSEALPAGKEWVVPESLQLTRKLWAVYVRNDLLSVAFLTVLAISLREMQPQSAQQNPLFKTIEHFSSWFAASSAVASVTDALGTIVFDELVSQTRQQGVSLTAWEDAEHETQLGRALLEGWKRGDESAVLLNTCLKLLITLAARGTSDKPYDGLAMSAEELRDYPINLISFHHRVALWKELTLPEVVTDLINWSLNTHLRVALRKLRQSSRATFQLRPSERGLEVVADQIPDPTPTTPRFKQAIQILRDLGVLVLDKSGQTRLSEDGKKLMEGACV